MGQQERAKGTQLGNYVGGEMSNDREAATTVVEPVAYQWLGTSVVRKRIPKSAEVGAWRPLYAHAPRAAEPDVPAANFGDMEPVAWMWRNTKTGARGVYFEDPEQFFDSSAKGDYEWSPLYTPPPRTALGDEQILAIGRELGVRCKLGGNPNIDFDYARAIEAAHGIGGPRNE
jgi:hypothetical protein